MTAQSELTSITSEVQTLRDEVQAAQKDADQKFMVATKATDEVNQMRRMKTDLEERQKPLQDQVAALRTPWIRLVFEWTLERTERCGPMLIRFRRT